MAPGTPAFPFTGITVIQLGKSRPYSAAISGVTVMVPYNWRRIARRLMLVRPMRQLESAIIKERKPFGIGYIRSQFRGGEGTDRHIPLVKHFHKSPQGKAAEFGSLPQRELFNLIELRGQKKPGFGSGNSYHIGYINAYLHDFKYDREREKIQVDAPGSET
jgi:hypothetical protein